jgi:magnesium chelatase family protein
VASAGSLADAVAQLTGQRPLAVERPRPWEPEASDDACPVRGQEAALAAARIAAAGAHNLLLVGPPGAGKTLVARHLANLLPALSYEEAREVTRIHGVAGLLPGGLVRRRPFRAPHHTTSLAGLVGGGTRPRPGEVSLAHLGVLFLDELPEFSRGALEALRQPLEDGSLVLGRASGRARLPTEVVLVAAMNPCPCGWLGVGERCRCSPRDVQRYQRRISGPLRDRFDLLVRVEPVDPGALVGSREGQDAKDGKDAPAARVARAVAAQRKRQARFGLPRTANARIPAGALPRAALPSDAARRLLVERARAVGLTGRGVHRVLRVARTVADLQGSDEVEETHVMQALGWRSD